jgi:hypothetical protein
MYDMEYDKKTKKMKNETQINFDLKYGRKHSISWKIRNAHCRTWNKVEETENHGK